ncbi:hypothetical protein GH5_01990 [Leishmania sp. Ghana 2012 LV757]|uniref:hypothetical protein n=1 Tax=Leishmania sp. Ghana 2012 LV757 TaxID=2803181 RepID=UPI001B77C1E5|nr:hypothetical protein GH5_01990 [Leishmania sp. Ghana 2012 LV757]
MTAIVAKALEASRDYTASLRAFFSIPPRSESMAGVIILFVFMNSMANSIWMSNAWTPFVYLLFNNSNTAVGIVAGVNGFFELSCAMLGGHIADKVWGPSRTLIFAVRLGMVRLCVVALAIWMKRQWLLVVAQMFEGCYMGLSLTCVESVFAQCLRTGERDRLYSLKFSVESAGPIVGLISSIFLYVVVGTEWNIEVLQIVMTCGLLLHMMSMITFSKLFVALPSHLDRRQEAAAATDVVLSDEVVREGYDVPSAAIRTYDVEENRVMDVAGHEGEEEEELSPSNLVQRDRTELMNCARRSILQATNCNCPLPLMSRYEPSVCTARNEEVTSVHSKQNATAAGSEPYRGAASVGGDTASMAGFLDDDAGGEGSAGAMSSTRRDRPSLPVDIHNIPPGAHIEYVDHEYEEASACRRSVMHCLPLRIYPLAIVSCDVMLVMGSGMIVRYLPLFLMKNYHVTLATICTLNLCNSFVIVFLAIVNGAIGKRYGRIRAVIPPKMVGTFLLLYMALEQKTGYCPKFWMCLAFVFRNALMNCSAGLSRALIMDLVPEERRSRWNALESLQSAGWSGSAILGGLMADKHGYGAAFIFTFFFHLFSTSALIPFTVRNDARLPMPVLVHDGPTPQGSEVVEGCKGLSTSKEVHAVTATTKVVVGELTTENVRKITSSVLAHREAGEGLP